MKKLTPAIIDDRGQLAQDPGGSAAPITDLTRESASDNRQHLAVTRDHGSNHLGRAKPMMSRAGKFAIAIVHDHPNAAFGVVVHRAAIGDYFAGRARRYDHPNEAFGVVVHRAAIGEYFAGRARR